MSTHKDNLDGEGSIYEAVKDLDREELSQRVRANAQADGLTVTDEHLDVIWTLVGHYKEVCATADCHEASPHMRFLKETYRDKGGSKYLYHLFDQRNESAGAGNKPGVLTLIHRLAGLPDLTHNVDEGFGTSF